MTEVGKGQLVTKEADAQVKPPPQGELKMLGLFFFIGAAFLYESMKSEGVYQGISNGPGSMAQMISTGMIILIVGKTIHLLKSGYKEGSFQETLEHLFNKEVVIMLGMIVLYGIALETLTFIPTSLIFMSVAMYLLDRKQPVKKFLTSCGVLAGLWVIFAYIFQIILP